MDDFSWTEKEISLVSARMGRELTRAEVVSLASAAKGLSAEAEATELGLAPEEVRRRRRQLLAKLGSPTMREAVARLKGGPSDLPKPDVRPGPRSRLSHLAERVLA